MRPDRGSNDQTGEERTGGKGERADGGKRNQSSSPSATKRQRQGGRRRVEPLKKGKDMKKRESQVRRAE